MMKHEFEELAGIRIDTWTYDNVIEPMYMSVPDSVSKREFVGMLNLKAIAEPVPESPRALIKKVKAEAAHQFDICGHDMDWDGYRRMEESARLYAAAKFGLDFSKDSSAWFYFEVGYQFPTLRRGCTFPRELVIGHNNSIYERVTLIAEE